MLFLKELNKAEERSEYKDASEGDFDTEADEGRYAFEETDKRFKPHLHSHHRMGSELTYS